MQRNVEVLLLIVECSMATEVIRTCVYHARDLHGGN